MTLNLLTVRKIIELKLIKKDNGESISARQLRHILDLGHLKGEKVANTWFVDPQDIENFKLRPSGRPFNNPKK